MRSTRSQVKRQSSEKNEIQPAPPKRKKYQVSSESSYDSDESDDDSSFVESSGVVKILNLSEDSDSDSSDDRNESKVEEKVTTSSKVHETSAVSSLAPEASTLSDDSDTDHKPVTSDYFDFTEILQSQKVASEILPTTSPSKFIEVEPSPKKEVEKVPEEKRSRRQKNSRNKNSVPLSKSSNADPVPKKSVCKDINSLSVAEMLQIGENITNKKEIEQLNTETTEKKERKEVEITIALPELPSNSRKKKRRDLKEILRLKLNAKRREVQVSMHKVHVLVWIAHGNFLNSVLNSQDLLGLALSLIPSKHSYPPKHMDIDYLEKLTKFFRKKIPLNPDFVEGPTISESLVKSFEKKETKNNKLLIFMFICVLRALGLQCRLVLNLVTVPLKPLQEDLLTPEQMSNPSSAKTSNNKGNKAQVKNSTPTVSTPIKQVNAKDEKGKKGKKSCSSTSGKKSTGNESSYFSSSSPEKGKSRSRHSRNASKSPEKSPQKATRGKKVEKCVEAKKGGKSSRDAFQRSSNERGRGRSKRSSLSEASCSKDSDSLLVEEDFTSEEESDSDTFISAAEKRKTKNRRRVLSTDDEEFELPKKPKYKKPPKQGVNVWAEVFAEAEEKWLSVDVISTKIHVTQQLYNGATHPVAYVLAWNNDQTIKDVTRRYVTNYISSSKRHRVEPEWVAKALAPYRCGQSIRDKEEDEDLNQIMQDQPKPATIAEYKNHPLYALKRHLLKFEAIYPPDAPTLGFFKDEPIYARECVRELHSRETWLKEARLVRVNETPYKIAKARPKYDKFTGTVKTDIPLELFGEWQTEDYMPPIAKDGIVPRNAYGNVDLFKPSMLPIGTVYLELPGLIRVARKLNIDCAEAITGFDFHSGGSHPVIGGYVVCEEFRDIIVDAWNEEADNASKKEEEKRVARIYKNWRRLIKGAIVLNRIKSRYKHDDDDDDDE